MGDTEMVFISIYSVQGITMSLSVMFECESRNLHFSDFTIISDVLISKS